MPKTVSAKAPAQILSECGVSPSSPQTRAMDTNVHWVALNNKTVEWCSPVWYRQWNQPCLAERLEDATRIVEHIPRNILNFSCMFSIKLAFKIHRCSTVLLLLQCKRITGWRQKLRQSKILPLREISSLLRVTVHLLD